MDLPTKFFRPILIAAPAVAAILVAVVMASLVLAVSHDAVGHGDSIVSLSPTTDAAAARDVSASN